MLKSLAVLPYVLTYFGGRLDAGKCWFEVRAVCVRSFLKLFFSCTPKSSHESRTASGVCAGVSSIFVILLARLPKMPVLEERHEQWSIVKNGRYGRSNSPALKMISNYKLQRMALIAAPAGQWESSRSSSHSSSAAAILAGLSFPFAIIFGNPFFFTAQDGFYKKDLLGENKEHQTKKKNTHTI